MEEIEMCERCGAVFTYEQFPEGRCRSKGPIVKCLCDKCVWESIEEELADELEPIQ